MKIISNIVAPFLRESEALFFKNEIKILAGKSARRITLLSLFVFLSILSVSFSYGGMRYLKARMDSPFVTWMKLPVTVDVSNNYTGVQNSLKRLQKEGNCFLEEINGYRYFDLKFFKKEEGTFHAFGRTVSLERDTSLMRHIFAQENCLDFREDVDGMRKYSQKMRRQGIIVSRKMLRMLGLDENETTRLLAKSGDIDFPLLHVIAIVDDLPDRTDFVCFEHLAWSFYSNHVRSIRNDGTSSEVELWIRCDESKVEEAKKNLLVTGTGTFFEATTVEIDPLDQPLESHQYVATIGFSKELESTERTDVMRRFTKEMRAYNPALILEYNYRDAGHADMGIPDAGRFEDNYSSFNLHFSKLDSIRSFRNQMFADTQVDISLDKVEALENFHFVSILTKTLSLGLVLFTCLSLILYLSNLFTSHIESIKMNLGTFLAFGLNHTLLIRNYMLITSVLIIVVILGAILAAWLVDVLGVLDAFLVMLNLKVDAEFYEMFTIFNFWTMGSLLIFFSISLLITLGVSRRQLSHSPGDLIYDRT